MALSRTAKFYRDNPDARKKHRDYQAKYNKKRSSAIGNGIPFQDKRNEDIPEICFIITELDDFCEQETVIGDSRMIPELCA